MLKAEDPQRSRQKPSWHRLAGLGFELFGVIVGFILLGTWIDRSFNTSPRGFLICAILGILGGLYNLIRTALQTLKESESSSE